MEIGLTEEAGELDDDQQGGGGDQGERLTLLENWSRSMPDGLAPLN